MYFLPYAAPPTRHAWVVVYDARGTPFWVMAPCNRPRGKLPAPKKDCKDSAKEAYRVRVGNWEEMYDAVDGKKTWYNTKTKKTTKKDPFW